MHTQQILRRCLPCSLFLSSHLSFPSRPLVSVRVGCSPQPHPVPSSSFLPVFILFPPPPPPPLHFLSPPPVKIHSHSFKRYLPTHTRRDAEITVNFKTCLFVCFYEIIFSFLVLLLFPTISVTS